MLVTVTTPGAPSSLRVYVWRRLRSLGALYLQQSVCLLPERADTTRAVLRLVDRVRSDGGEARVLHIALADADEEQAVIEAFRAERSDEYREVCARAPAFLVEIDGERAKGRLTYAEVEKSEADLHRLQAWLAKIHARDYFDGPGRAYAEQAVTACSQALAALETDALAADSIAAPFKSPTRHLRAVSGDSGPPDGPT